MDIYTLEYTHTIIYIYTHTHKLTSYTWTLRTSPNLLHSLRTSSRSSLIKAGSSCTHSHSDLVMKTGGNLLIVHHKSKTKRTNDTCWLPAETIPPLPPYPPLLRICSCTLCICCYFHVCVLLLFVLHLKLCFVSKCNKYVVLNAVLPSGPLRRPSLKDQNH